MDDKKSITEVIQELSFQIVLLNMFIIERELSGDFSEFMNEKNMQFNVYRDK